MKFTTILIATFLSIATQTSLAIDFKADFKDLTIKPINEYPNVGETISIQGLKNVYLKPSTIPLSNRAIYNFLKSGVDKKNLKGAYLKPDFTWDIYPILDMQPGWEDGYNKYYLPKYYSFPPLELDMNNLSSFLSAELNKSPWPKEKLKENFKNIFSKATPVYINDLMFFVDKDSLGYYSSNLLGLTRFALPLSTSPTNSAIHLSKAKLSVKTLIHEYLHDKIRYSSSPDNYPKAEYQDTPLLGLDGTWDDTVKKAYQIRRVIDLAYLMSYPNPKSTWWSPLANTPTNTSNYSFTTKDDMTVDKLTKSELWDVMTFMEEFIVRVVVEALFKNPDTAVIEVISDIPGLHSILDVDSETLPLLQSFTENYYLKSGESSFDEMLSAHQLNIKSATNILSSPAIVFTEAEQSIIDTAVADALVSIKKLGVKFDKEIQLLLNKYK